MGTRYEKVSRLASPLKRLSLALCAAVAAVNALADNFSWTAGSGSDTYYSTAANWDRNSGYPESDDGAMFIDGAAGKTATFDAAYTPSWAWTATGSTTSPVTWEATDPSYGMTTTFNIGLADAADQTGALVINSGTYTAGGGLNFGSGTGVFTMSSGTLSAGADSYWANADNASFTATISGGTINFNGTDADYRSLVMMNGTGISNTINISGGTVAVNGGDLAIGVAGNDTSSTTINISNGGLLQVGTTSTERWCKLGVAGTSPAVINVNEGGTIAFWMMTHTSTGACELNVNGGTIKALGTTTFGTMIDPYDAGVDTFTVTIGSQGGTLDTNGKTITISKVITGTGGLTKKGTGTLTFSVMPTFSGTLTVAEGADSVILPSGATIAAGTDTLTRTTSAGVEYYYFSGSAYSSSAQFTAGADATITLSGDAVLNVDDTKSIGKLTVTGSGVLSLYGSGTVTASSLQIDSGVTVQLVSATTLATGPLQTSLVTGSGTIVYDAVPDGTASDLKPDEAGYTASTWTGTVWIQNCIYRTATGSLWTDPAAYGNSGSKVKFTNARIYLKAGVVCDAEIVLSNIDSTGASKTFGLMLTDGNGGQINKFAKLSGDGTFSISGSGGATEIISIRDIVDFSGVFNLPSRIVVIGDQDGTIAQQYVGFANTGAIVIPEGVSVSVPSDKTWVLGHGFVGAGTLKYTYPWQVGTSSLSNGDYWTGTVELAACVNNGTGSVAVYPGRMGSANSKIVFKGLAPGSSKGYFLSGSTSATIQLDGDVTISDGTSGATYSLGVLTGTGNFIGATTLGTASKFVFSAVSNYTGTISANSKSLVTIGTYITDSAASAGQKLVSVDSSANSVTVNNSATVSGETQYIATALQDGADGYGVYVTAVQRNVYWIGGDSGSWSDTTAWALADGTPLNAYPSDYTQYAGDNVIFTNNAVVVADCRPVITKMTLNADVTLSTTDAFVANTYAGKKYLFVETVEGEGTFTLSNAVIAAIGSGRPFKIYTPVCVADGTRNSFGCSTFVNYLYGDLSGSGYLEVRNGNYGGLYLYGDNSEFCGEFYSSETTRCISAFYAGNATSSKAIWKLRGTDQSINHVAFITDSSTYYFGALLEGSLLQSVYNNPTLEVGARDEVASVADLRGRGVDSKNNKYYFNITKVGTNVFTVVNGNPYYENNIGNVLIEGGTLALPGVPNYATYITFAGEGATLQPTAEGLDFSALIKNSSTPICFDDNGEDFTWATQLASSNIGGLTKKGAGTLTLTAVPQYSGPTVVEAGKLVVPIGTQLASVSGSGTLVVDLANTTDEGILFSVASKAEETTIDVRNVPESATRLDTANGVIYYSGTPQTYYWNPTGDSRNWGLVDNWLVGGSIPSGLPTPIDTVEFDSGASVVIDAQATALMLNGGGDLTITAEDDLVIAGDAVVGGVLTKWGMASVNVKGSLTASSVAVGTGAVTAFSGSDPTELSLDSGSTSAYAIDDEASALGYGAKYAVAQAGSLLLEGNGQLFATGDQTVNVESAATTNTFVGSMSGSMSLSKTGAGTLALFGNNAFTGDFAIEAGTVKLNTPLDLGDVRCDFDASDESAVSYANDGALLLHDAVRSDVSNAYLFNTGTNPKYVEGDATIFNGKKVLYSDSFKMVESTLAAYVNVKPRSSFFVMQNLEGQSRKSEGYKPIATDYAHDQWYIKYRNFGYLVHDYQTYYSDGIWANGTLGDTSSTASYGANGGVDFGRNPAVVTVVSQANWLRGDKSSRAAIGGSGKQAWAEYLSYTRELSFDEKAAVEQYLMAKWGINNMEYTVLPKTANLTMATGTKLEMGGLTQTVASFAGAGTIANGYLKTTGDFTATGSLTVQAAEGQTYTLSQSQSDNLTFTGDATGYLVKVPDDASSVSRVVVPHGVTVGFDFSDGTYDVTIVNAPTKWAIKLAEGEVWDTYTIGYRPFFVILR